MYFIWFSGEDVSVCCPLCFCARGVWVETGKCCLLLKDFKVALRTVNPFGKHFLTVEHIKKQENGEQGRSG